MSTRNFPNDAIIAAIIAAAAMSIVTPGCTCRER